MADLDSPVRIHPNHSPHPSTQEHYTVLVHHHRVRTVVTSVPSAARRWIHNVRSLHRHRLRLVAGLGVQWSPRRRSAATLQLCVGHRCLVFQLGRADRSPAVLRRFLADDGVTFVGVRNHSDARLLEDSHHRLEVSTRLFDAREVVDGGRGWSMERLAEEILGMEGVEKKEEVGRSDWDEEWLSEAQVEYAVVDVFVASLMGRALRVWDLDKI